MQAIVKIAGQQFKVSQDQRIFVHRLKGEVGEKIEFSDVLMTISEDQKVVMGANLPKISATIIKHIKGDKVIVFKTKRRKGYQVKNGHRQYLTQIKIDAIA